MLNKEIKESHEIIPQTATASKRYIRNVLNCKEDRIVHAPNVLYASVTKSGMARGTCKKRLLKTST